MNNNCYYGYHTLCIQVVRDGRAMISTCWCNTFRQENRIIIEKNIKDSWNSSHFQFQRKSLLSNNRNFCRGVRDADCMPTPYYPPPAIINDNDIKNALSNKKTVLNYQPKILFLIPSCGCNNYCFFCHYNSRNNRLAGRGRYDAIRLRDGLIKEIKRDIIPHADYIIISGGEPFYSPSGIELIEWIIRHYPQKKLTVITNGTLLDKFGIRRIMSSNISLRVSFYGMNRETYKAVTGQDNFDIMFKNVNELIKFRYKNIRLAFIITHNLTEDVEDFCKFIKRNIDSIEYAIVYNIYGGRTCDKLIRYLKNKYPELSCKVAFNYRKGNFFRIFHERLYNPCNFYNPWYSVKYLLGSILNLTYLND